MDVFSLVDEKTTGSASFGFGISDTIDNYIAAVFVKRGRLPKIGDSYFSVLQDDTIPAVTIQNFAYVLKDLTYGNKAIFVPKGYMNGSKNDTVNLKKGQIYGLNPIDSNLGAVTESGVLTLMNFYNNISGLNALRSDPFGWDIVLVTNTSVEIIYADQYTAQIGDVLDAVSGDSTKARNGRINWLYRGNTGQVVPIFGIHPDQFSEYAFVDDSAGAAMQSPRLSFQMTQGTLVNLTAAACSGEYKRFTRGTGSTLSTMQLAFSPAISCVTWEIEKVVNGIGVPANGTNDATVVSTESVVPATSLVSFPAAHPAGTTRYIVTVRNETGVYGIYKFEVVI